LITFVMLATMQATTYLMMLQELPISTRKKLKIMEGTNQALSRHQWASLYSNCLGATLLGAIECLCSLLAASLHRTVIIIRVILATLRVTA
jgi:hypothetical protein